MVQIISYGANRVKNIGTNIIVHDFYAVAHFLCELRKTLPSKPTTSVTLTSVLANICGRIWKDNLSSVRGSIFPAHWGHSCFLI
jgi:hypothetical protein